MPTASRNTYLDVVKGITISLVVFAHCIQFGAGPEALSSGAHFNHWLFKLIYTFHMPVFMIVSGYLFYYSVGRYSTYDVVKKRFSRLLLPVIVWQTLFVAADFFLETNTYSTWEKVFTSYLSTLWFLVSLFINCIVVLFVKPTLNRSTAWKLSPFLLTLFIPYHPTLCLFIFMFPYFLFGYLVNSSKVLERIHLKTTTLYIALAALLTVFIFMYIHYRYEHYIYTTGTFIISHHHLSLERISIVLFRWTIGFMGTASFLLLVYLTPRRLLERPFVLLGRYSMGIYICSTYIFLIAQHHSFSAPQDILTLLAETAAVIAVSCITIWLINRSNTASKLLLGG